MKVASAPPSASRDASPPPAPAPRQRFDVALARVRAQTPLLLHEANAVAALTQAPDRPSLLRFNEAGMLRALRDVLAQQQRAANAPQAPRPALNRDPGSAEALSQPLPSAAAAQNGEAEMQGAPRSAAPAPEPLASRSSDSAPLVTTILTLSEGAQSPEAQEVQASLRALPVRAQALATPAQPRFALSINDAARSIEIAIAFGGQSFESREKLRRALEALTAEYGFTLASLTLDGVRDEEGPIETNQGGEHGAGAG